MATTVVLHVVVLVALTPGVLLQREPTSHAGTTPYIKEVFTGRCWDYDETKYRDILPRVEADCPDLWTYFFHGFGYMPPCKVSMDGYGYFFQASHQQLPKDKVMFWSGVYSLAHRLSDAGRLYVTLEDTMMGYLANSIVWCGQSISPGMNNTKCPEWSDCPQEASESFWAGASVKFASQATGNVTLMLGGSNPQRPAYRRDSIFGKYELTNLPDSVTYVNVIVTHVLGGPKFESCDTGSLLYLKEDVERRGLNYNCTDDSASVMYLLCADDPSAEECQLLLAHARGELQYPDHTKPRPFNSSPLDRMNSS